MTQKNKKGLKASVHDMLRQPPRTFYSKPILYLCGREAEISGFREILDYSDSEMHLLAGNKRIAFYGTELRLLFFGDHKIHIKGNITEIKFDEIQQGSGGK